MPFLRLPVLLCAASLTSFAAGTWSGVLLDSKCFTIEENNVNPFDGNFEVNHDRNSEIHTCRPNAHTKSFIVLEQDGESFKLDPTGNAKAADLVQTAGKRSEFVVAVTGEMSKDTVKVDSISILK